MLHISFSGRVIKGVHAVFQGTYTAIVLARDFTTNFCRTILCASISRTDIAGLINKRTLVSAIRLHNAKQSLEASVMPSKKRHSIDDGDD